MIEAEDASVASVRHALKHMMNSGLPTEVELAADVPEKYLEKYDEFLPDSLLASGYGSKAYDVEGARRWLQDNLQ